MKPETIESLLHDMRGFLECWSMWLMPGSPINIRSRDWFADFVTRLDAITKSGERCELITKSEVK